MDRLGSFVARVIATAGGAGYSPVAPGTAGTLVTVPIAWLLRDAPLLLYLGVCAAVIAVGIVAAGAADRSWQTHDSGRIVIDEVAGYLCTMAWAPRGSLGALAAGFVLFRILDIVKPPPCRAIDRRVGGGLGVVLDDVVAGLYGALILHVSLPFLGL